MIQITKYCGQKVGILGFGATGVSAAESLSKGGANVLIWDDHWKRRCFAVRSGFRVIDFSLEGLSDLDLLFVSPGVPLVYPEPNPIVAMARSSGIKIISDIELLQGSCPSACYVGVTGTNGKSTVTSLLGHVLSSSGKSVQTGGNLGEPALSLQMLDAEGIYVLELSSYQLDLTQKAFFDVAVWTNLSLDHIERHGSLDGYIRAKKTIFEGSGGCAVVGVDDEVSQKLFNELVEKNDRMVIPVSAERHVDNGVSVVNGILRDDINSRSVHVMNVQGLASLQGTHNWHNAALAYAAARAVGVRTPAFIDSIGIYPGLPHRMETIGTVNGVTYINDSKATNVAATAKALSCFQKIYWIVGGRAKGTSVKELVPALSGVVHAYTIGESGKHFEAILQEWVPVTNSRTLAIAFDQATDLATCNMDGDTVVLLSPGCASFDQFVNFEARGEAFRKLVVELNQREKDGGELTMDGVCE